MSRDQLQTLQSARLVKLVDRVYHNVEFYRKKMQEMGIEPGDIKGIEDITKLPFTTKNDLRDNYPFGLFAVPQSQIVRVHASSGTTGKATVVGYTRKDIAVWSECVARAFAQAGLNRDDVIQIAYGYGLFTGGLGAHYGAENLGATVVPMSTGNTKKLITMMKDFGATAIACTPSYLLHIAETLEAEDAIKDIKLKAAICGAEPWTEQMRLQIEEKLGINAFDIYGLSEIMGPGVACDCIYHKGLHVNEDHFLPEILNPDTLAPCAEDELGEDNEMVKKVKEFAKANGNETVKICAKIEEDLCDLDDEEKEMFLEELGIDESGLDKLVKKTYSLLGLATFFTAGEKECRAWTFKRGMKAPQCAGVIHSDFERGFIRAEVTSYDDFVLYGNLQKAKEAGRMRSEGKEYVFQDGDIVLFRFNV